MPAPPAPEPSAHALTSGPPVCTAAGRDLRIDALKCLAILLVIATHILGLRREFQHVAPWLETVIVAFNMPLFAMLSGWVLAGREGAHPGRFLWRKVLSLYVPYLAWIAVESPLRRVPLAGIPARVLEALLDPHAGMQMWFLAVLFWMFVIFVLMRLVSRSSAWAGAVALAVAAVGLLPRITFMGIDKIAWLYPFFILGYLLARHRRDRRALSAIAAGAALAIVACAVLGSAELAGSYLVALALSGAVAGLYGVLPGRAIAAQAWLGRRTLGVYGAQMVVLPFLIVGMGWSGALLSWAFVAAVSSLIAAALEYSTFSRAVFMGQWPRRGARSAGNASGDAAPATE